MINENRNYSYNLLIYINLRAILNASVVLLAIANASSLLMEGTIV